VTVDCGLSGVTRMPDNPRFDLTNRVAIITGGGKAMH
jgi:hypothetical protein